MTRFTTGDAIVESLIAHGVDTIFGIPGVHTYDLVDAIARRSSDIRFIGTRHEQGAGYMAYGYARTTGRVGVYTVVPGPGMLNSSAALSTALGGNTPVLCLTGNIMRDFIGKGRGQLHELPDQLATLRSITKWAERIDQPSEAAGVVDTAFAQMLAGRRGPAAIEVPWDVFGLEDDIEIVNDTTLPVAPAVDADAIREAAALLGEASCPMIMVGAGAMHASAEVQALAEFLQAPVTAHRSGKGVVSNDHPLSVSSYAAYQMFAEVDVVVGIGSRLELPHMRWQYQPDGQRTIRIDIDPDEMGRLPVDVAVVADASDGTAALLDALRRDGQARPSKTDEVETVSRDARSAYEVVQPQLGYLDVIREVLPDDGFLVEEICQAGFTARFGYPVYQPYTYVTGGYQENLGFGFGTALGVKVAHPDRPVVSINGDGGFMFGAQELATAAHHNIGVVAVVFDNGAYGNVKRDQASRFDGRLLGSEFTNPDFVALGEAYGVRSAGVSSPVEFRDALVSAVAEDGPALIRVELEPGEESSPWPFTRPGVQR